jgi:hypothetical protein
LQILPRWLLARSKDWRSYFNYIQYVPTGLGCFI